MAKKAKKKAGKVTKAKKTAAKKSKAKKTTAKRASQRRETLSRGGKDIAYAKRRADGTFKEIDDVGRSLSADRRRKAKKKVKKGYGDQGDQ
jgi:exo-beta-1,3-glucanase (GH17 family)